MNDLRILINNKEIQLFHGAKLKHGLLKFNEEYYKAVRDGKATLLDQYGNLVEMNGAAENDVSYTVVLEEG